jgi:hypothetical protein
MDTPSAAITASGRTLNTNSADGAPPSAAETNRHGPAAGPTQASASGPQHSSVAVSRLAQIHEHLPFSPSSQARYSSLRSDIGSFAIRPAPAHRFTPSPSSTANAADRSTMVTSTSQKLMHFHDAESTSKESSVLPAVRAGAPGHLATDDDASSSSSSSSSSSLNEHHPENCDEEFRSQQRSQPQKTQPQRSSSQAVLDGLDRVRSYQQQVGRYYTAAAQQALDRSLDMSRREYASSSGDGLAQQDDQDLSLMLDQSVFLTNSFSVDANEQMRLLRVEGHLERLAHATQVLSLQLVGVWVCMCMCVFKCGCVCACLSVCVCVCV